MWPRRTANRRRSCSATSRWGRRLLDRNEARIEANAEAGDLLKLARAINSQLINLNPSEHDSLNDLILSRISSLSETSLDNYFVNRSLEAGILILNDLIAVAELAQTLLSQSERDSVADSIAAKINELTEEFFVAADAQKAIWQIDQYLGRPRIPHTAASS